MNVRPSILCPAVDLGTMGHWSRDDSERELEKFVRRTFGVDHVALAMCEYDVAVGKPAPEILRVAPPLFGGLIGVAGYPVAFAVCALFPIVAIPLVPKD